MSFKKRTPLVLACLGDSLTFSGTGAERKSWPSLIDIDQRVYPLLTAANHGKAGDTCAGMLTRWTNNIRGKGYWGLRHHGLVNDLTADTSGATAWASTQQVIDEALADEMPVWLTITSGFKNAVDYTPTRGTELLAYRSLALAYLEANASNPLLHGIDLYTLLADPNDAAALNPAYDYGDGKHYNTACDEFLANYMVEQLVEFASPSLIISVDAVRMQSVQLKIDACFAKLAGSGAKVAPAQVATAAVQAALEEIPGVEEVVLSVVAAQQSELTPSQVLELGTNATYYGV